MPPPDLNAAGEIEQALGDQDHISDPETDEVLLVIFEFPAGADQTGEVTIDLQLPATLPKVGLIDEPQQVLDNSGLYIGVQNEAGSFVNLMLLTDPRVIRTEEEIGGRLEPDVSRVQGGVVAARIPFEPLGTLQLFETAGNQVTRVHLDMPLGGSPFPGRGRRGAVKP